jgi:hypothetical protein
MVMESSQTTGRKRAGSYSGLTWWTASGFAIGIVAMLGLMVLALATPVDAEVARSGPIVGWLGGDLAIRLAGVLIFVLVTGALLAQSARHSRLLEAREQQRGSRPRE